MSFDHNLSEYNSGIGIVLNYNKAGDGHLRNRELHLLYSYIVKINSKWRIRSGLDFGFTTRDISYNHLLFGDQIDETAIIQSQEQFPDRGERNYFDFSSGTVFHNETAWIGNAAHHINRPNLSFQNTSSPLPIRWTVQGGYKIELKEKVYKSRKPKENSISPVFIYRKQGSLQQLDLGCYWNKEPFVAGISYRNIPFVNNGIHRDAVIFLVGLMGDKYSFAYSYDITISSLQNTNSAGSHEFSLLIEFGKDRVAKTPMNIYLPCPKF